MQKLFAASEKRCSIELSPIIPQQFQPIFRRGKKYLCRAVDAERLRMGRVGGARQQITGLVRLLSVAYLLLVASGNEQAKPRLRMFMRRHGTVGHVSAQMKFKL